MEQKPPSWSALIKSKLFLASAFLLIVGATLDNVNSQYIHRIFPGRQPIEDVLFNILPYYGWTQYFSDLANIFSCILLAIYIFPRRPFALPFALSVLGLGYSLRSIFILLNPFGGPLGNQAHYGITQIHQYGQFPSGHMFLVVAIYFLINNSPILKRLALISVLVEIASLLFSHGHYSIDIIGGWLVAYFSYNSLYKVWPELATRK